MTRVAVVGGGLAGLTAATTLRALARAQGTPLELDVFEAGAVAGGQLRTTVEDGFLIDWGANAFRTGIGGARDLTEALGLGVERVEA
ncbi:MAG: NAD(P)-binding protein, partial [Trueperaceae bacterium]|nr:NAD(P)-binding protein [Trueperaceae bacterium]